MRLGNYVNTVGLSLADFLSDPGSQNEAGRFVDSCISYLQGALPSVSDVDIAQLVDEIRDHRYDSAVEQTFSSTEVPASDIKAHESASRMYAELFLKLVVLQSDSRAENLMNTYTHQLERGLVGQPDRAVPLFNDAVDQLHETKYRKFKMPKPNKQITDYISKSMSLVATR